MINIFSFKGRISGLRYLLYGHFLPIYAYIAFYVVMYMLLKPLPILAIIIMLLGYLVSIWIFLTSTVKRVRDAFGRMKLGMLLTIITFPISMIFLLILESKDKEYQHQKLNWIELGALIIPVVIIVLMLLYIILIRSWKYI